MGKHNKGKNKKGQAFKPAGTPADILNKSMPSAVRVKDLDKEDDGEWFDLAPKEYGRAKLEEIRLRRSKKFAGEAQKALDPAPYASYSPNSVIQMLDEAINKIRDGKFKKALEKRDKNKIDDLTDAFLNMDRELPNFQRVASAIGKLIQIGKSFYEYDDNHRSYMDDAIYDRILEKYRAYGFDEPTGFVPNSKSKVGIKYPTLHNNMDKSYMIHSGEQRPEGVKEDGCIEDWLLKSFKTLGLSSETEVEIEISPKIDGTSVNGTIRGQGFFDPQTRGDENESVPVPGLNNLMVASDDVSSDVSEFGIQYELFVTNDDRVKAAEYLKLNKPYVSNRHAASGIVNRLASKVDDGLLEFVSLYPIEASGLGEDYSERMDAIAEYGVVPDDMIDRKIIKGNIKDLLKQVEKEFAKLEKKRGDLSYTIDGMVLTFVDSDYQKVLGRSKRTNNYQIALKFDPANAEAKVAGIHLDTGKKGYRTIQVDLKHPVFLDGVRYDHVPVLSAGLYEDLGLREGSVVRVHRVGDVIPSITVIESGDGKKLTLPEKCPHCGLKLRIKNKKLYCNGVDCPGNAVGLIQGFLEGVGMDGYGEAFAKSLINDYGMKNFVDLFDITEESLAKAGLTSKIYRQFPTDLRNAIADTPDYKILGAIGIPDIGPARAKDIIKACGGWKHLIGSPLDGVSRLLQFGLYDHFNEDTQSVFADIYLWEIINKLDGMMKTFTTKFDNIRLGHTGITPSDEVKRLCEKNNIDIVDGKSFDLLLTASMDSNSDKMQSARKKDVPIYTEEMFISEYKNRMDTTQG